MKKFRLIIPMCALSLGVLFTNCVDNTESEGVNAMRTAQADLISAKAEAERLEAEANVALLNAQAELQAALVANQILLNTRQEIYNEQLAIQLKIDELELLVAQAETENDLALLTMDLELSQASYQASIALQQKYLLDYQTNLEVAKLNAERDIATAEENLRLALLSIEKAVQATADDLTQDAKDALADLTDEYRDLLDEIVSIKYEIIDETTDLAQMDLDKNLEIADLKKAIESDIVDNAANTLMATEWLAKYQAIETSNNNQGLLDDVLLQLEDLNNSLNLITEEIPAAQEVVDVAQESLDTAEEVKEDAMDAWNNAYNAYYWAKGWQAIVTDLDDADNDIEFELTFEDQEGEWVDFILMFNKELDDDISGLAHIGSVKYYENKLAVQGLDEDEIAVINAEMAFATLVRNYMNTNSNLSSFSTAYTTARTNYEAAVVEYDSAMEELEAAQDAKSAINDRKDAVNIQIGYAEDYADALTATKEDLEDLINDELENIADLEAELADLEYDLSVVEVDVIDWAAKKAVKELEIANLEEKLATYEADAAAVKAEIDALL